MSSGPNFGTSGPQPGGRSPPYVPSLRNAQPWFMCTSAISMRHVRRYGHFLLLVQWQPAGVERHICHPLYHLFFCHKLMYWPFSGLRDLFRNLFAGARTVRFELTSPACVFEKSPHCRRCHATCTMLYALPPRFRGQL